MQHDTTSSQPFAKLFVLRRLFHRHKYERVHGSEKLMGYLHGLGIYNVEYKCNCGKIKNVKTDMLF